MTISKRLKLKHECTLNLGSDSMLPKATTKVGNMLREVRKWAQISERHPLTFQHFRSYPAVVAERHKLLLDEGRMVIHPLSIISLVWGTFMACINLAHMMTTPVRCVFIVMPLEHLYDLHAADYIVMGLNFVCLIDMRLRFNMGYIRDKKSTVMKRSEIACRYLRRWFVLDLASCMPLAIIFHYTRASPLALMVARLLPVIRIVKLYNAIKDIICFLKIFTMSYIVHGYAALAITFVVSAHWCSCLIYLYPVSYYYYLGATEEAANLTGVFKESPGTRYNNAIIISLSSFFGTGYSTFRTQEISEIVVQSFIICYGTTFMICFLVYSVKSYMTLYQTFRRHHGLMQQVEQYMNYRQFPVALKNRLRAFYRYRYHNVYYKERAELDCLSKELSDKIRLLTCGSLVDKVMLFEGAPPSMVGSILGCLKPEVFLCNDLVFRAGDIGDCMYFVDKGTVAVYSLKGVEVFHLEDGAYFGEVALIMKDRKRVSTVVAVETTLLYRLHVDDFRSFIMSQPMLYERIQKLAPRRIHEISRGTVNPAEEEPGNLSENIDHDFWRAQ